MTDFVRMAGQTDDEQTVETLGGKIEEGVIYMPPSYFSSLASNPDWVVLIGELMRPGVQFFSTKLEHTFFKPGTELNSLFNLGVYAWKECFDFPYLVIAVPSSILKEIEKIAESVTVRLVPGVPMALTGGPNVLFPINGKNAYKLENVPGSAVYATALKTTGGLKGFKERTEELLAQQEKDITEFLVATYGEEEAKNY